MSNFSTGPRHMSASLTFSHPREVEITLGYSYSILWTGEDYEVTVMSEPDEEGQREFIDRATRPTLALCVSFVKTVLRRDILMMIENEMIVYSEEI